MSIIGIALLVMLQQLTLSYRETGGSQNRVFAYQRAMAMLAELQAGVERGTIPDTMALEALADFGVPNPVLTTVQREGSPLPPDHPMSGNIARDHGWAYDRLLEFDIVPGQSHLRFVRIRVMHRDPRGARETLATLTSMLTVPARAYPPVQVHDVYVLALAECPSLWQPMATLRQTLEDARAALRTSCQNLDLRLRWITKLGYGRDQTYIPYVNTTTSASAAMPWAYVYPGRLDAAGASLYMADLFAGRIRTETGIRNGYDADRNRWPCAVADQWNHCLRWPEAKALFDQRAAAGLEHPDEPPLQILLEEMHRDPERFRGAMFLNAHGQALPMPPLRNYADAAKEPVGMPLVRAVTHAALLRPMRDPDGDGNHADTQDAEFRVYAYKTDPASGAAVLGAPITLEIVGRDLSQNVNGYGPGPKTLDLRCLQGGVNLVTGGTWGADREYRSFDASTPGTAADPGQPYRMWYECWYAGGSTWLRLHNTPLTAATCDGKGLPASERLYGLEYIPSPVNAGGTFATDLESSGFRPKNTARWRIRVPRRVFEAGFPGGPWSNTDTVVTVRTRLGTDPASGTVWPIAHEPNNLSVTHAWWARMPQAVPLTERFQLLGDPRHCPYADLAVGGTSFPHGYGWTFDDLREGSVDARPKWPCFDPARLAEGFGEGFAGDAARMLSLWREALQDCGAVFTNLGGATANVLVQGGEIALPQDDLGQPWRGVTVHGALYGITGTVLVDSISPPGAAAPGPGPGGPAPRVGQVILRQGGASTFWVKEWLGELYPDDLAGLWYASGNLGAGNSSGQLAREARNTASLAGLPAGTSFRWRCGSVLGLGGGTALLECGQSGASFTHRVVPGGPKADLQPGLAELAAATGIQLPSRPPTETPLRLDDWPAHAPLPHFGFTDSYPRSTAYPLETLYARANHEEGALAVQLLDPTGARTALFALLGLTPGDATAHADLARAGLLCGVRTFHLGGLLAGFHHVRQLPRLELTHPAESDSYKSPAQILLKWKTPWLRFDGRPYAATYPDGFSETEGRNEYVLLASRDRGTTWTHALTGQAAEPGRKPADPGLRLADAGPGDESYILSTPPAAFPEGEYLLRVECWNTGRVLHPSWHQVRIHVLR